MSRGRLIRPLTAEIARVDPATMISSSNYDRHFRNIKKVDSDGDGIGERTRAEFPLLQVQAQIEVANQEQRAMTASGDVPNSRITLVIHLKELEDRGLVDSDGRPVIKVGDRLVRLIDRYGNIKALFERVKLYATEVRLGDGWLGYTANLLLVQFDERKRGRVGG